MDFHFTYIVLHKLNGLNICWCRMKQSFFFKTHISVICLKNPSGILLWDAMTEEMSGLMIILLWSH